MKTRRLVVVIGLVLVAVLVPATVSAAGLFERSRDEPAPPPEEVVVPEWAQLIMDGLYRELYPGPEGTGYVGVGTGSTREEALAAAAVEYAANVSTEVEARVMERQEGDDGQESFAFRIESDVRSQAIISGLTPEVWTDPRTRVVYALYRSTQEEYERRLQQWIATMATMSEVNRQREVQRLEDERAAAERRQEEIQLEELREQVRQADRRMRADRHRDYLYKSMSSRIRTLPTGYIPDNMELTLSGNYSDSRYSVDGSLDFAFWNVLLLGGAVDVTVPEEGQRIALSADARLMVQLLRRVGWTTSSTLSLGGFVTAGIGGSDDTDWFDSGEWLPGPFVVYDILIPEWAHTRYGVYAGRDAIQARFGWYPLWRAIEDAISVNLVGSRDLWRDNHYVGAGLVFRPVDPVRLSIESTNLDTLRGTVSISF